MTKFTEIRAILATNLKTGKVQRFINAREAAKNTGVCTCAIMNIAKGKTARPRCGYTFAFDGKGGMTRTYEKQCKPVFRIDPTTNQRTWYPSIKAAAEANYATHSSICSCAKKKQVTAVGYYWEYDK